MRVEYILSRLMLITDRTICPLERLPEVVAACARSGVDTVQLRDKDLPRDERLQLAWKLREVTRGTLYLVNGDPEIAAEVSADGVVLPEGEGSVADARARGGWAQTVARSVHSVEAAEAAQREGARMLIVGTIFPSRSHPGGPTGGLALLRAVRDVTPRVPVVAVGGITAANAGKAVRAGADGVAVVSAILGAPDPARAASDLRAVVDRAWEARIA